MGAFVGKYWRGDRETPPPPILLGFPPVRHMLSYVHPRVSRGNTNKQTNKEYNHEYKNYKA